MSAGVPVCVPFESIRVGDAATVRHTVTQKDIKAFATISGDRNPLHVDAKYARKTQFGKPVVHGMFIASFVSQLVGMKLPGLHSLLVKESLAFGKPVFVGETITAQATVVHKSSATRLIELAIEVKRKRDIVAFGNAHVRVLHHVI